MPSYKEKRNIAVKLTGSELLHAGKALAKSNSDITDFENKKKEAVADFGTKINRAKAEGEVAARLVSTEEEYRDVECDVVIDIDRNRKTIIRPDTGEIVEEQKLTNDDLQYELNFIKKKEENR